MSQSLDAYLILAGILFAVGSFGFLARRNAISMLMSIELMLNAVNLVIVAFGAFVPELNVDASVIALMVMAVAAAEATVGLAIVMAVLGISRDLPPAQKRWKEKHGLPFPLLSDADAQVQQAFRDAHALQCGYCTPGFLLSAVALANRGVKFEVCEITLKNRNLKKEQFIQEVNFTPSGVVRIAKLQVAGSAYIKP